MFVCLDRSDLEKEVAELRAELRKASVQGEVDDLKRTLDRSEKERIQLCARLEVRQFMPACCRYDSRVAELLLLGTKEVRPF